MVRVASAATGYTDSINYSRAGPFVIPSCGNSFIKMSKAADSVNFEDLITSDCVGVLFYPGDIRIAGRNNFD